MFPDCRAVAFAAADAIRLSRRTPLSIVFCDPVIASVGQKAKDLDPDSILTGEVSFEDQGRARIMQENRGRMRLYAAKEDGRLLGAEMAAPAAEHMAHLLALAIGRKLTVHDLLRMPYYHPTVEEATTVEAKRAAAQVLVPQSELPDVLAALSGDVTVVLVPVPGAAR